MTTIISSDLSHARKLSSTSADDPQTSNLTTLTFVQNLYRLASIEPSWFQQSPDDAAECSRCGATLTFCFASRLNKSVSGLAVTSLISIAIRCARFLAEEGPPHYGKLVRQPVQITPEKESSQNI
jgi:hypothetical protein